MMQATDDPMAAFQPPPAAPSVLQLQQQQQQQQQHSLPPTTAALNRLQRDERTISNNDSLPYSLYDVILDLPNPGASTPGSSSSSSSPAKIYYPPSSPSSNSSVNNNEGEIVSTIAYQKLISEFGPESISSLNSEQQPQQQSNATATTTTAAAAATMNVAKIARFAFPDYEDQTNANDIKLYTSTKHKVGWNNFNSNNLNKYDVYLDDVYSSPPQLGVDQGGGSATSRYNTGGGTHNNINYSSGQRRSNNNSTISSSTASSSASSSLLPSHHTFSHRLTDGTIVHGHVRKYLPYAAQSNTNDDNNNNVIARRNVGRRSVRALVILTRNSGGGSKLYMSLLKSMEIILLLQQQQQQNDNNPHSQQQGDDRLYLFLQSLHLQHVNLCRSVGHALTEQKQQQSSAASAGGGGVKKQRVLSKPWILTVPFVELGQRGHHHHDGLFGTVDFVKFVIPSSFLHGHHDDAVIFSGGSGTSNIDTQQQQQSCITGYSRNDMMPMLRCLGVHRTMRLLSALMSERRVIITCSNVTKLSAVAYGAMSMLGQGLLSPPSVFVPVLPPGLVSLLSSPTSYLIGVLTGSSSSTNYINLRNVTNIGEVVLFDLDMTQQQAQLQNNEPYFHNMSDPHRLVPDLTRRNVDDMDMSSARIVSIADVLFQDLNECIKADKKLFWQGAVQEKLTLAAAKGKKVASEAMKKGLKYLKSKKGSKSSDGENRDFVKSDSGGAGDGEDDGDVDDDVAATDQQQGDYVSGNGGGSLSKLVGKGNYAYEEGFSSEKSEEDARIAFTIFFVCLFGDIRSYLTQKTPGEPPMVDKEKFMKYRAANGDMPGSGMFLLIANFLRGGKIFDAFVAARLNEVQMRRPVPEDSPLFALVTNYHRLNKIDFATNNVRQTVRQIATQDFPTRYLIDWNTKLREKVSQLTSTQAFNGDFRKAVMQLTEDCHESSTILIDTMMVLWTRMQEGKGLQWKKALLSLQIFRSLLLNGPINAVSEAVDGFASIRILKSYTETLRSQNSKLVRDVAIDIHSLVVDLPVLFARRRESMNARRLAKDPKPSPIRKETRMIRGISQFRNVHTALRPKGATVAPIPTVVNDLLNQGPVVADPPASAQPTNSYSNDLLSLSFAAAAPSPQMSVEVGGQQLPSTASQSGSYSNDLLFGASPSPQVVGNGANDPARNASQTYDPFNMQVMSQATPTAGPSSGSQQQPQQMTSVMIQPSTTAQPRHAQSHPPPMNSSFSMMSNNQLLPQNQPMQQQMHQQQSQTVMTVAPQGQGGNFPPNYHHHRPPQFAPNIFQPEAPATGYPMAVPQFHQAPMKQQQPMTMNHCQQTMPQNTNTNAQKK